MRSRTVSRPAYRGQMIRLLDELGEPLPERFRRGTADEDYIAPRKPALGDPKLVRSDLILPLPHADVRVRVHRRGAREARPLLLWLHDFGGVLGGSGRH